MKEFKINKEDENIRLDKFVKKVACNAPLSLIYKVFRKKDVKVNKIRQDGSYLLKENDIVTIYLNDEVFEKNNDSKMINNVNLNVIYEDSNILIVNKPKGILIHGDKNENTYTLSNMVISYLYNKKEYIPIKSVFIPSPVHRLDRNTSGICIFAKNVETSQILMEEFKNKINIEKHYIALLFGNINESGTINVPLFKNTDKNEVYVDFNNRNSKPSITKYKRISCNNDFSLVDANLITGRTHQIRVHFAYLGYPIVGDEKYGDFNKNKEFDRKYSYKKQFLHAYSIEFKELPSKLEYLSNKIFKAELSEKEKNIISKLNLK